jgi:hypothetical protein
MSIQLVGSGVIWMSGRWIIWLGGMRRGFALPVLSRESAAAVSMVL